MASPESASYDNFTSGFWSSQQAERSPACVFKAPTEDSVSIAVLLARVTRCRFAAKSGGHAAFEGASNVEGGITISFEKLNGISVSSDNKTVAVGPGNTWYRVYSHLTDYDFTVIGGRVASIGVGGLTTGGGISFLSNLHGWACDNVASYNVVLASGQRVTASFDSYPDLYWALRGGGNNFGLVVSFKYYTVPLPDNEIWTSVRTFLAPSFPSLAQVFHNAIVHSPTDPNAGLWVAWVQTNGTQLASTTLWSAEPSDSTPKILEDFDAMTPISEDTGNKRLADFTAEGDLSNPIGLREMYYSLTVKADSELAEVAKNIFYEEVSAVEDVQGALPVLIYQGITSGQISAMGRRGGNALGLTDPDEPLYLLHVSCWWDLIEDDERVYTFASKVLQRIRDEAEKRGKASRFLYMNYSSKFEDVVTSYGEENKERLKRVEKRYDPKRIFQVLQPGYFKLDGPPVEDDRYFSG